MNNNRQSDKLGEWTELDLTELDQIFGGHRWFENGYYDGHDMKYVFSTPEYRWGGGEPDGGEFYGMSFPGMRRKRWVVGKHIFDWDISDRIANVRVLTFKDDDGQKWGRMIFDATSISKGDGLFEFNFKGNGSKIYKI